MCGFKNFMSYIRYDFVEQVSVQPWSCTCTALISAICAPGERTCARESDNKCRNICLPLFAYCSVVIQILQDYENVVRFYHTTTLTLLSPLMVLAHATNYSSICSRHSTLWETNRVCVCLCFCECIYVCITKYLHSMYYWNMTLQQGCDYGETTRSSYAELWTRIWNTRVSVTGMLFLVWLSILSNTVDTFTFPWIRVNEYAQPFYSHASQSHTPTFTGSADTCMCSCCCRRSHFHEEMLLLVPFYRFVWIYFYI